ncbi:MAG: hypothetical protein ACRC62_04695 [Microcoleus sp.]
MQFHSVTLTDTLPHPIAPIDVGTALFSDGLEWWVIKLAIQKTQGITFILLDPSHQKLKNPRSRRMAIHSLRRKMRL